VPHPLPPGDLNRRSLPLVSFAQSLFRIHDISHAPLHFGHLRRYRFDAPAEEFGVLYCGVDIHCAFIETFGHDTGIGVVSLAELKKRGITRIEYTRPLRLVDLTGSGLAWIGADNQLCTGDYAIAQRWSFALHAHPERPDGIYYRACHDPSRVSAAIYDQVAELFTAIPLGTLADPNNRALLGDILDTYRFGLV